MLAEDLSTLRETIAKIVPMAPDLSPGTFKLLEILSFAHGKIAEGEPLDEVELSLVLTAIGAGITGMQQVATWLFAIGALVKGLTETLRTAAPAAADDGGPMVH